MTRFFALVAVLAVATVSNAAELQGSYSLRDSNIETFDPATFAAGPNVDVYTVSIVNPNDGDATSLELNLVGDFQNFAQGGLTFKADDALPTLGPNTVAESFFIVDNELAVAPTDEGGVLAASYTISGGGVLVPANGEALVAVVSIPAGGSIDEALSSGRAAIGGAFETVSFGIPEPSTAILAGLALVGFAARRNG